MEDLIVLTEDFPEKSGHMTFLYNRKLRLTAQPRMKDARLWAGIERTRLF